MEQNNKYSFYLHGVNFCYEATVVKNKTTKKADVLITDHMNIRIPIIESLELAATCEYENSYNNLKATRELYHDDGRFYEVALRNGSQAPLARILDQVFSLWAHNPDTDLKPIDHSAYLSGNLIKEYVTDNRGFIKNEIDKVGKNMVIFNNVLYKRMSPWCYSVIQFGTDELKRSEVFLDTTIHYDEGELKRHHVSGAGHGYVEVSLSSDLEKEGVFSLNNLNGAISMAATTTLETETPATTIVHNKARVINPDLFNTIDLKSLLSL